MNKPMCDLFGSWVAGPQKSQRVKKNPATGNMSTDSHGQLWTVIKESGSTAHQALWSPGGMFSSTLLAAQ